MAMSSTFKDYGSNQSSETTNEFNLIRQTINENTQRIRRNNIQMQKMIGQIGGPNDTLDLRDKLHKLQHQTNNLAKETNKSFQTFMALPLSSSSNAKQQRQIREQLTEEFTKVLKDFQAVQRSQMDGERGAMARRRTDQQQQQQRHHQTNVVTESERGSHQSADLFGDSGISSQQQQQQQQQTFEEAYDLESLEESEGQLRRLEADISDINGVFRDLSLLVHQQSEFVDSIEANVESASGHVVRGTEELLKARQYRDKIRRRKVVLIAVATVFVALVIVIIIASVNRG